MMASMSLFGGLGHYAVILSLQQVGPANRTAKLSGGGVCDVLGIYGLCRIPAPPPLAEIAIIILPVSMWRRENIRKTRAKPVKGGSFQAFASYDKVSFQMRQICIF